MITRLFFLIFAFTAACNATAQNIEDPVKWSFTKKKIDAITYEVRLQAKIEDGWHIYSQTTAPGGPVPTTVTFSKNPLLTMQGELKEVGKLEKHYEQLFGVEVKQYSDKVEFVQIVKVKAKVKTTVSGTIQFMACDDEKCLPPAKKSFSIVLQ